MSSGSSVQDEELRIGMNLFAASVIPPTLSNIEKRINELSIVVNSQAIEIAFLKQRLNSIDEARLPLEKISKPSDKMIRSVSAYLKSKKEAYPSDIADALGISIKEVMRSISFLQRMNKVEEI